MSRLEQQLDAKLDRLAQRLPRWAGGLVRRMTGSAGKLLRIPLGLLLIGAGIVGFLPILGFWMVPLGLVVIARDVPFLQRPAIRLLDWIERKWPQQKASG